MVANSSGAAASAGAPQTAKTAANIVAAEAENRERERAQLLLSDLVSSEGQFVPTLKAVYDNGKDEQFSRAIDDFVEKCNRDIKRLCGHNYSNMFESVDQLFELNKHVQALQDEVKALNVNLQESGSALLEAADELERKRYIVVNMARAVKGLTECIPVVQIYRKVLRQVSQKRFYSALIAIEALEVRELPKLPDYSYVGIIRERLPHLRMRIKLEVRSDAQDWLEGSMKACRAVGIRALERAKAQVAEESNELLTIGALRWEQATGEGKVRASDFNQYSPTRGSQNVRVTSSQSQLMRAAGTGVLRSASDVINHRSSQSKATESRGRLPVLDPHLDGGVESASRASVSSMEAPALPTPQKKSFFRAGNKPAGLRSSLVGASSQDDSGSRSSLAIPRYSGAAMDATNPTVSLDDGNIDCSVVYRCLHIYELMQSRSEFAKYYKDNRWQQISNLLDDFPVNDGGKADLRAWVKALCSVMGFFVIEDTVMNTTSGLLSRAALDDVWDMAINRLSTIIQETLTCVHRIDRVLEFKELLSLFFVGLQEHSYNASRLTNILPIIHSRYRELLAKKWGGKFLEAFHSDDLQPLRVNSQEELNEIAGDLPYAEERREMVRPSEFPAVLGFTSCVPKIYSLILEYLPTTMDFMENLNLSQTQIDARTRRDVRQLIETELKDRIRTLIHESQTQVQYLVQIVNNLIYINDACARIDGHVTQLLVAAGITLAGTSESFKVGKNDFFSDVSREAEDMVVMYMRERVKQFFGLADYEWTPAGGSKDASEFVDSMIMFLQSSFSPLTMFPTQTQVDRSYARSFEAISGEFHKLVLSDDFKIINRHAFQTLHTDISAVEEFADLQPVPNLRATLLSVRQLVDLFRLEDFERYIEGLARRKPYGMVEPAIVLSLLDKYYGEQDQHTAYSNFRKTGRDRKKAMNDLIQRLTRKMHELALPFETRGQMEALM
eukprot:Clim_evm1s162 gene=Clim_evmTU1s162